MIPESSGPLFWEMVADEIKSDGWSVSWVRASVGKELIWYVDASKDDGRRFIARAEEIAVAMLELQKMIADPSSDYSAESPEPEGLNMGKTISPCI